MKRVILTGAAVLALVAAPQVAFAAPNAASPIGGPGAHPHHVHTGSGCVDIDQQVFEPLARGLHRGASEGAPDHGTCAGHAH